MVFGMAHSVSSNECYGGALFRLSCEVPEFDKA